METKDIAQKIAAAANDKKAKDILSEVAKDANSGVQTLLEEKEKDE